MVVSPVLKSFQLPSTSAQLTALADIHTLIMIMRLLTILSGALVFFANVGLAQEVAAPASEPTCPHAAESDKVMIDTFYLEGERCTVWSTPESNWPIYYSPAKGLSTWSDPRALGSSGGGTLRTLLCCSLGVKEYWYLGPEF